MKNKVFIIAEAGVNHNGVLKNAYRLVDLALEAGADAVKFQTFNVDRLLTKRAELCSYQKTNSVVSTQFDLLKPLQLKCSDFLKISDYCKKKNIEFMSTAFDVDSLSFLVNEIKIKRIKIPSGEIVNPFLLLHASRSNLPIIMSTGLSNLKEIQWALKIIFYGFFVKKKMPKKADLNNYFNKKNLMEVLKKNKLAILHCISEYPALPENSNLKAMINLNKKFSLPIGLSDHSTQREVPLSAVAMGASIIEKHITLNKKMKGPDHKASLSCSEFKEMVKSIRLIESILGSSVKKPSSIEMKNKNSIRGSLVASKKISIGEKFTWDNIAVKRPGDGLNPRNLFDIIGRKSKYNFLENDQIKK